MAPTCVRRSLAHEGSSDVAAIFVPGRYRRMPHTIVWADIGTGLGGRGCPSGPSTVGQQGQVFLPVPIGTAGRVLVYGPERLISVTPEQTKRGTQVTGNDTGNTVKWGEGRDLSSVMLEFRAVLLDSYVTKSL